jgi:hypothetical protein
LKTMVLRSFSNSTKNIPPSPRPHNRASKNKQQTHSSPDDISLTTTRNNTIEHRHTPLCDQCKALHSRRRLAHEYQIKRTTLSPFMGHVSTYNISPVHPNPTTSLIIARKTPFTGTHGVRSSASSQSTRANSARGSSSNESG